MQVLSKHQPACEAVKEPIHYCCALWLYVGYEILKLHLTLRNKNKGYKMQVNELLYIYIYFYYH